MNMLNMVMMTLNHDFDDDNGDDFDDEEERRATNRAQVSLRDTVRE